MEKKKSSLTRPTKFAMGGTKGLLRLGLQTPRKAMIARNRRFSGLCGGFGEKGVSKGSFGWLVGGQDGNDAISQHGL